MNEIFLNRAVVAIALLELLCAYKQLHMLQLNSYNIDSHFIWIKKNLKSFISNIILLIASIIRLLVPSFIVDIVIVILLFTILIENLPHKAKKKFVITYRIIRLIISLVIILFLTYLPYVLCKLGVLEDNSKLYFSIILIGLSLEPLLVHMANAINTPIEKILRNRFINDAKSMLDSSSDLITIGVTGSYGKTSVKNFLHHLLSIEYGTLKTPDSFNTTLGVTRAIRENLNATHKFFIAEMGARRRKDIKEICDLVNPKYCIISSIGPQHLETFKTIENIASTKFELVDSVIENSGKVFVCGDNKYIQDKLSEGKYKSYKYIFTYGINKDNNYYADNIHIENGRTYWDFVDNINNTKFTIDTSLLGNHNIQNLVGVIALCVNDNFLTSEKIIDRIKSIKPIDHRLELKNLGDSLMIDDAFNSNPDGAKAALDVLATFDGYEKIIITPGMVELGSVEEEENKKLGLYASSVCNRIYMVGKKRADIISKGIEQNENLHEVKTFDKVEDAIIYARALRCDRPKVILIENDLPDNYL